MARADTLKMLYASRRGSGFNFDALSGPPLLSLLSAYDLKQMYDINNDPHLKTKVLDRIKMTDQIMGWRNFKRMVQGTNRIIYRHLEDQSFVVKLPITKPGEMDGQYEMQNQRLIKPFVTKCFDVAPTGAGCFERVEDVTSIEQFKSIAPDVFVLLDNIIGKYVMNDVGTKSFRNYGIRLGFGPVLLDYPMLYEVDGAKLYCTQMIYQTGQVCNGLIDYDEGFNTLRCEKCGRKYNPSELEKKISAHEIIKLDMFGTNGRRTPKLKITVGAGLEGEETVIENNVTASNIYLQEQKKKRNKKIIITGTGENRDEEVEINIDSREEKTETNDNKELIEAISSRVGEIVMNTVYEFGTEEGMLNDKEPEEAEPEIYESLTVELMPETSAEPEEPEESEEDEEDEEIIDIWADASEQELKDYIHSQTLNVENFVATMSDEAVSGKDPSMYITLIVTNLENICKAVRTKQCPEDFISNDEDTVEDAVNEALDEVEAGSIDNPEEVTKIIENKIKKSKSGMEDY